MGSTERSLVLPEGSLALDVYPGLILGLTLFAEWQSVVMLSVGLLAIRSGQLGRHPRGAGRP